MENRLIFIVGALSIAAAFLFMARPQLDGKGLFRTEGCLNCHSFKGQGGEMGPDLTSVVKRRSDEWIRQQIKDSKKHNPDSRMPSYDYLSEGQIGAIIRFLKS